MEEDPATLETIDGKPVLRLERRLAHSPKKVWRAITEPDEMAHWFPARVETELKVGAVMRFTFEGQVLGHPDGHLVRFERDLVWRPAADIWAALIGGEGTTEDARTTRRDLAVGAPPPPASTTDDVPAGPLTAVDPPHLLEYTWRHEGAPAGRVRWEVLADPKSGHRIVVTQTVPARLADLLPTALAARQTHLELLFATLFGSSRPVPAERTRELEKMYADRLG